MNEQKHYTNERARAVYSLFPYNTEFIDIIYGVDDVAILRQRGKIYARKIHYNGEKTFITFSGLKRYTRDFLRV